MKEKLTESKMLLILQTAVCLILAVLLITSVISIYREGAAIKSTQPLSWIFTRERVVQHVGSVVPLLFFGLGLTAAGLILQVKDKKASLPVKDAELIRNQILLKLSAPGEGIFRERKKQQQLLFGGWIAFGSCMVPVLLYLINADHFPNGDLEPVFLALMIHSLPWIIAGIGCLMVSAVLREKSILREIDLAREQLKTKAGAGSVNVVQAEEKRSSEQGKFLRWAVLIFAVCLIIAGIFNGSARDVFGKAVKICTECVGLG